MEMDARRDIRALSFAELDLYYERVAVVVGWISVRIFGEASPAGERVAAELGRALQLTNILRDLAEDAQPHRLYLPRELLHAHGIFAPLDRDSTQMTDLIDKRFHRLAERCPAVFEAGLTLALHK
jgi:phytoene/squalene synthetase